MSIRNIVTKAQEVRKCQQDCIEFLRIVTSLHDGAAPSKIVTSLLRLLCRYGKSIPYIGGLLNSVENVLPNEESKDVAGLLQNLSEQMKAVRQDIGELENKIIFEAVKLEYFNIVGDIKEGMEYLSGILMSTGDKRKRFENRLKKFCYGEKIVTAVRKLHKLLTGEVSSELSLEKGIVESIYCVTRGHRVKIDTMCFRFLQLVSGGLSVIAAYETLVHGEEGALDMEDWFKDDTEKLKTCFEDFRQKCKVEFRDNMLKDLGEAFADNKSNKETVANLSRFLQEKYDWLENCCVICNKSFFIDYDFREDQDQFISLECSSRFGVIFYRESCQKPDFRSLSLSIAPQNSRLSQARQIIRETDRDCWFSDAARINRILNARLSSYGFSLWGCATVKAKRIISIPLINIAVIIGSNKALGGFEISGTLTKAVYDVGGHKHLCLLT